MSSPGGFDAINPQDELRRLENLIDTDDSPSPPRSRSGSTSARKPSEPIGIGASPVDPPLAPPRQGKSPSSPSVLNSSSLPTHMATNESSIVGWSEGVPSLNNTMTSPSTTPHGALQSSPSPTLTSGASGSAPSSTAATTGGGGGGGGGGLTFEKRPVAKRTASKSGLTVITRGLGGSGVDGGGEAGAAEANADNGGEGGSTDDGNKRKSGGGNGGNGGNNGGNGGGDRPQQQRGKKNKKKKGNNKNNGGAKMSKEERRALHEANLRRKEEARKAGGGGGGGGDAGPSTSTSSKNKGGKKAGGKSARFDDAKTQKERMRKQIAVRTQAARRVTLFSHLPQYAHENMLTSAVKFSTDEPVPPVILQLGLRYAEGAIVGSNARCVALLVALRQLVWNFKTSDDKRFAQAFNSALSPCIQFLEDCRPKSVSMGNAIKWFKLQISNLEADVSDREARRTLVKCIDTFVYTRIVGADNLIAEWGAQKIKDGDVILTYACSHAVESVIKRAFVEEGKQFRVVVADSRPKLEGKNLLKRLSRLGIPCTYVLVNGVSYVCKDVTKVFIGAYACLANGSVVSRVGTGAIALVANTYNVPVIVCCETYKFCDRVQLDAIVYNELGDPDALIPLNRGEMTDVLSDWRERDSLKVLNLTYDLTPMESIAAVVSEVGIIPPTSIPVILRHYHYSGW